MPVTLVDRLPLPNLKVYSAGSVLLLSVAVYYAICVTSDPSWKVNATLQREESAISHDEVKMVQPDSLAAGELTAGSKNVSDQFMEVMTFMMQEPLCMWTLINMAYCSLALFGLAIQRAVFGRLRVSEAQRVKDKFWNYVFYKFIFVFGVLNVQYMDEVLLWSGWFTVVGFLHLLGQLCKDRFDYLSSSASVSRGAVVRLLCLLAGMLLAAGGLAAAAVTWGLAAGRDTFAFMIAECLLVAVPTLHVMARYTLRARNADAAGATAYYTHLAFDSVSLVVETCHVCHMVVYSNVVVSMASLVLLMQLRHLLHALLARLRRHRLYTALSTHMTKHYPMASVEEVMKHEDKCAICWEPMTEARKLPCKHLFHNSCLCRWVQQDASCPTCRRSLQARPAPSPAAPLAPLAPLTPAATMGLDATHNHLFHFDGSRYVSWLPSFSVEVTRVRDAPPLDDMVDQVLAVFPQYGREAVMADLARSRSPDVTVHNILEGRLPPPPPPPSPSPPPAHAPPVPLATPAIVAPIQTHTPHVGYHSTEGFSSVAAEREDTLRRRKEALLAAARRRYLDRRAAAGAGGAGGGRPAHTAS
ncbi:E3 ubiquitin-protein ligase AMFR-like [Danaus plexippus]|uniref:E3 ubiquitin-protein ligase AMFR-like n=1 Tax=Danaus plexippus TaxID=13037 RepID=UPI002AB22712|nr:E3 ubiquitin-protein ligase AMFR-like [Danaus plexippus]